MIGLRSRSTNVISFKQCSIRVQLGGRKQTTATSPPNATPPQHSLPFAPLNVAEHILKTLIAMGIKYKIYEVFT